MNTYFFDSKERHIKFRQAFTSMQHHHELKAQHFVLWNIIRGLTPHRGFTPIRRSIRIDNGHAPYGAFHEAVRQLTLTFKYAREFVASNKKTKQKDWLAEFLKPFDGALTAEDIIRITVPVLGWDTTGKMTCDGVVLEVA